MVGESEGVSGAARQESRLFARLTLIGFKGERQLRKRRDCALRRCCRGLVRGLSRGLAADNLRARSERQQAEEPDARAPH